VAKDLGSPIGGVESVAREEISYGL